MKIILSLTFFFSALVVSAQELKSINAFDNKFTMQVPTDIDSMSAALMKAKYNKKPDGKSFFYSDATADFSIVITPVADDITEAEMIEHKKEFTDPLAAKYTLVENDIKKVNNHSFIVMSFYSAVPDGKIFNRRFFAVVNKKMIMVAFNSSPEQTEKRKQQIEESIISVVIN